MGGLSFGGGTASQLLLRKELVWRNGWLDEREYQRLWQLSKLSLGINQIAQVIIFGRRFAGWRGIPVALCGFLLPSVTVTIGMTAVLVAVIGNRFVEDALRLIIPLTGGMTMGIALQMWGPELPSPSVRKWLWLLGQGCIVLICSLLVGVVRAPVPLVMASAILAGVILLPA